MATILLGAVGASVGGAFGGTALGLSSVVVGRAIGATVGRALDAQIMGSGSSTVEAGQVDRFRLTGASEGSPISNHFGRMRVSGQVVWASEFVETSETSETSGGGKGSGPSSKTTEYSYTVSLAIALCDGPITRVGRIWADGVEISRDMLNMRVYSGDEEQLPDAKIEAVLGVGAAPAYRGIAYVVLEDLDLGLFGNRVPQLSFEILKPVSSEVDGYEHQMPNNVHGVALIPGTGEYSLATTAVNYSSGFGVSRTANVNSPSGKTDFVTATEALDEELQNCDAASLVVSWFGDDLRCGECNLKPKVEQAGEDGEQMPWTVTGLTRATADVLPVLDNRTVYGGTPTDQSVVEGIEHLNALGKQVMFYPFILMEQIAGNARPNPWAPDQEQPQLPWRGRITTSLSPGVDGSIDGTAAAQGEVDVFFGVASVSDFTVVGKTVLYSGPNEWSFRRFILHYAYLCVAAGGVDSFCIGSELRSLTQIRAAGNTFPTVVALKQLAADVRTILGTDTKISYASDWTEYFGYHPQDGSGDVFFHLDPLWSDDNIDFIGIDNYMPMSDWRDNSGHLDAEWGDIHNLDYLTSNIEGGEGYDWYYHSPEAREAQIRTDISDGAHNEPWVFRYKDIRNWWENAHHNRVSGVRETASTDWIPGTKPIWFTEIGCAAIDKATNQPNKFLDKKSVESSLPRYSDGRRDELIQLQYLTALSTYWSDPENNPTSEEFGVQMIDMKKAHVWAWDCRPYPFYPNNTELWSDGVNYARGHWISGRTSGRTLAYVVAEICIAAGVADYDVSELFGYVRGYSVGSEQTARSALQPLMLAFGFDALERDGVLIFKNRDGVIDTSVELDHLVVAKNGESLLEAERTPEAEVVGRVRLNFIEADGDYQTRSAEAIFPDEESRSVAQSEISLAMTKAEGTATVERWLSEARVARDSVRLSLPPSSLAYGVGDVISIPENGEQTTFRIDRVESGEYRTLDATRVETGVYKARDILDSTPNIRAFVPATPPFPVFLDIPLASETENPHAPYLAVTADPWPGSVAVFSSPTTNGYGLNLIVPRANALGQTLSPMFAAPSGRRDNGVALRVKLTSGTMASANWFDVLNGANFAAIGDGSSDNWELFQFQHATLVSEDTYDLTVRLRGQMGTDAIMPDTWPPGSTIVLLDASLQQISLQQNARDLVRHYKVGPASRSLDDPSYVSKSEAFKGIGLRPYSPVHLVGDINPSGDSDFSWVRRTRIDGDSWSSFEVPLGESNEAYLLRVIADGQIKREVIVNQPNWAYTQAEKGADGVTGGYELQVAQLSDRFGPGPAATLALQT